MFGNSQDNQLHGHIDMGGGRLGAETIGFKPDGTPIEASATSRTPIEDVKIIGASSTSLRETFLLGVASSIVAGVIVWYAFEDRS
jgi:hypothetical protein